MNIFVQVSGNRMLIASVFGLLQACGSSEDNNMAMFCPDEGTAVSDAAETPWGESGGDAIARVLGSSSIQMSAELPSGSWSSAGTLETSRSGDATLFDAEGYAACDHTSWLSAPLTLTLTTDDGAFSSASDATGEVWGTGDDEFRIWAHVSFLDLGEPFASIVAEAEAEAAAEGCSVDAPYDWGLLVGTFADGSYSLDISWSCDGGDSVRSTEYAYGVDYVEQ